MSLYAKNTMVSVEKSRVEIEKILASYGATAFAYATSGAKAMIKFNANDRQIMFILDLPDPKDRIFTHTRGGKGYSECTEEHANELWAKACRRTWRSLALLIKAKMVGIADGIAHFENEFLANIVMPDGKTVSAHTRDLIETAYKTGKMQPLLPHFGDSK